VVDPALLERARGTERFAAALRELAERLPDEDGPLEAALAESVRDRDEDAFANSPVMPTWPNSFRLKPDRM